MIMQLSTEAEPLPINMDKIKDEYDTYKENNNGGGMSPPLSPPPPTSPAPTMVPPMSGTDRRESLSSSSPGSGGGLAGLHHALHGLHNLHNLHNLHSLQNLQTQMAALAGLQGGLGVPGVSSLLHSHLAAQHSPGPAPENITSSLPSNVNNGSSSSNQNGNQQQGSVPQMVLTAGQVAQGVQGAQLLIPTSQGIAVQPILTIPLGQAGSMNAASSLVNPLTPLHHLHPQQQQQQHQQQPQHHQPHHQQSRSGSTASSPLPTSSSSSSSSTSSSHPLLGLAGLPPTLFHPHHGTHNNNNNNNNSTNNNNIGNPEKPKLPLPLSSPVQDSISSLSARLGGGHYPHHPPPSRYSPDFLDTHNQPTISQSTGNVVDGVNLDEIKEFAKAFKIRRLSLGLTQTQVGQALSITEGPAYSQSAICRYKNGQHTLTDFMGNEPSKKRKRRTSFTPQALEVLNAHFERNTHPSGAEITALAEQLGYEREVVRIWFCNKRQALKNTVRMMAKGAQPQPPPPPPPPHSSIN